MFVGCQKSFIAAPTFDEREATRLARRVCQSIDDILASCPVANAAHDALDTFHPNFQFHGG